MVASNLFLIRAYALICAALALDCLRVSLGGGIPMPPETHGGAMYAIPGELWSAASLAQGLMLWCIAGSGRHVGTFAVGLVGGIINISLAVFSSEAAFGFIQSRIAAGAGMLHLAISGLALLDLFHDAADRKLRQIQRKERR